MAWSAAVSSAAPQPIYSLVPTACHQGGGVEKAAPSLRDSGGAGSRKKHRASKGKLLRLARWGKGGKEGEMFKGLDEEGIMKHFQAIKSRRMNLPSRCSYRA